VSVDESTDSDVVSTEVRRAVRPGEREQARLFAELLGVRSIDAYGRRRHGTPP
jgi:hypothetical protein